MLVAFGHALSFLVLFAATADAAERSGFASETAAFLCGLASILFVRLYVRAILAAQLDALHPPARIPLWAVAVYAAIGLVLILMTARRGETYAAVELLVAWAAGCNLLNYLWTRRTVPDTPAATDVADDWIRAQASSHPTMMYTLGFILLLVGVAAHAFQSGFAAAVVEKCGPTCAAPGVINLAAGLCGLAAILFVMVYATVIEAIRWFLVDSWRHVRPGPPPSGLSYWVIVPHVLIGFAVFIAMAAFAASGMAVLPNGKTQLTTEVNFDGRALLGLVLGWCLGGYVVLKFFWLRRRAAR